jgi:membrane protease YdiL (CAAX protease family)
LKARLDAVPSPAERREAWREVLLAFLAATLACAVLYASRNLHPLLAGNLHAVVAIVFWALPTWLLERKGRFPSNYGLVWRPLIANMAWAVMAIVLVLPIFTVVFFLYYKAICGVMAAAWCRGFGLLAAYQRGWRLPPNLAQAAAAQFIVVAVPEEYFFRGFLQGRLRDVLPPGRAIAVSSVLFGLGHYLVDYDPNRLAVAFPGVLFGLLREWTGSILPGALFHATCNLFIETLHRTFFG